MYFCRPMRLTELEIAGFKSFADRTKLKFDHDITGIVGPNGCGKSNIIDAMRWVLGEQRTRNLRSDKMENVLFNGTEKRKRSSVAEVSVTFENTRNLLPTEFTTVTLTRKYYRDGEGEYLLNNVPCRLKDIQDLLMDTGIGPDSYAIIELKMVDDLLNDKQGSRRVLFEEAAGIGKYKLRKKETLSKLDDTENSLTRVLDLLHEIEQNLKSLEKQAARTRQYLKLKEAYRDASSRVVVLRMSELEQGARDLNEKRQQNRDRQTELDATVARHEARITDLQKEATQLEQQLATSQKALNQHLEVIKKLETEKVARNERISYLRKRDQDGREQLNQLTRAEQTAGLEINQLMNHLEGAEKQQQEQQQKLARLTEDQQKAQQQVNDLRARSEQLTKTVRALEQQLQQVQKEIALAEVRSQSLQDELNRSANESTVHENDIAQAEAQRQTLQTTVATTTEQVEALRKQKQELEQQIQWGTESLNTLKDQRYQTQRQLDAVRNEHELTKSMVENLEGFPDSVRFLKKSNWQSQAVLLSDIFEVEENYKVALESYLEPWMNYYVVATRKEALNGAEILKNAAKGRANFFVLEELEAQAAQLPPALDEAQAQGLVSALQVVDCPKLYQPVANYLLRGVYLLEGSPQQMEDKLQALAPALPQPNRHVELAELGGITLLQISGNYMTRAYSSSGGSVGLFTGKKIGRARNLEKLGKEIERLSKKLESDQQKITETAQQVETARAALPTRALEEAQRALNQQQNELQTLEVRMEQYRRALNGLGVRRDELQAELQRLTEQRAALAPRAEELQTELHTQLAAAQAAELELKQVVEQFSELNRKVNEENILLVNLTNQLRNTEKDLATARKMQTERQETERKLREEMKAVEAEILQVENTHVAGEDEIVGLYEQRQQMQHALEIEEERLRQVRSGIQQNEQAARDARREKDLVLQATEQLRERASELEIKRTGLTERLEMEFGLNYTQLNEHELFVGLVRKPTADEAEGEMLTLRDKFQKFGEVNPTAVEAYTELKERYDFIVSQREDLLAAKRDLLATIAELDRTASEQFLETFMAIRENFQKVFQALFSEGDTADLLLTKADDPLESGIDVVAKPKGKRPISISQLSSGEKTLTAISLLFAIYLIKPAPFCIFDEVDAPLDDANIDKFNRIIQQFAGQSQFIIVTHNKRTMSHTQVMYGVTMEEPGISRLLPVNLETLGLK